MINQSDFPAFLIPNNTVLHFPFNFCQIRFIILITLVWIRPMAWIVVFKAMLVINGGCMAQDTMIPGYNLHKGKF